MAYRTASRITIIEGLEAPRRRPAMYIGEETADISLTARLVEFALDAVVTDTPSPSNVGLLMWNDNVFTIVLDGEPLPVAPGAERADDIPHPELYDFFMRLCAGGRSRALKCAGGVLNALSERLVVSTMSGGQRYRAAFGKGSLVSLLTKATITVPLGASWLTFRPDPSIVTGALTVAQGTEIVERVAKGSAHVGFEDRTADEADWW
jgi:DNA gyrase subunit B